MLRLAKEIEDRNAPLTELELNELLPNDGYEIVDPPVGYKKPQTRSSNVWVSSLKTMAEPQSLAASYEVAGAPSGEFPTIKPEDLGYFGSLLTAVDFDTLPYE
jgi:splicing factor 3B subunit 1